MNGANSDPTGYAGGGHGLRGENPEIGMYMITEKYRLTELVKKSLQTEAHDEYIFSCFTSSRSPSLHLY
jgi:hypothetical protein